MLVNTCRRMIENAIRYIHKGVSGYYLNLGDEHGLWSLLPLSMRKLAEVMGAEEVGDVGSSFCPEFSQIPDLVFWLRKVARSDVVDERLKRAIKDRMGWE